MRKISKFYLISWCRSFPEAHSFRRNCTRLLDAGCQLKSRFYVVLVIRLKLKKHHKRIFRFLSDSCDKVFSKKIKDFQPLIISVKKPHQMKFVGSLIPPPPPPLHYVKSALSSQRQFLGTESPLKMLKNTFYFA